MAGRKQEGRNFSRRAFVRGMRWAPVLFLPAPMQGFSLGSPAPLLGVKNAAFAPPLPDFRLTPHYPAKSPLDDLIRLLVPGSDEFVTEKYAFEIAQLLGRWSNALRSAPPELGVLGTLLHPSFAGGALTATHDQFVRSSAGIEVSRRQFDGHSSFARDQFLEQMKAYLAPFARLEAVELQIVGIEQIQNLPVKLRVEIRYDLVGTRKEGGREERIGSWRTEWMRGEPKNWLATRWQATQETMSRALQPIFVDVTPHCFSLTESYKTQMLHGADYWRTILDGASGIDVYGNNGLAAGDFDNDGFDELYVCQPSGLPNRLYRNRGDGTFEDVTERAGVGVLDGSACALFADFENRGLQDLLVVCGGGPLLFQNRGDGTFALKRDALRFAHPPEGTFTHAALADYDGDGRLDIYFCVYSYYVGLDQYRYPVPYYDARNGPPNFLLHNEGGGVFEDRTEAAGLNVSNDRYSFACAWGGSNGDGHPDLYVANDFGRSNLYRNNGDGTFTDVSTEAGVDEPGAGMSATWLDFNNDGKQDIYVANMWSAAGIRVSSQPNFHEKEPEQIRRFYRRHARGNSLYRNLGNGKFQNVSESAGAEMGRWAWCSDAWDFDHDGYADLYIANGYISAPRGSAEDPGIGKADASSFFWRQVVAKSPQNASPSTNYERGWNAVNELIRSDTSWNGSERNVFYLNNRDGTFSEISGVAGLDFPDDSRSFVLADIDHDGRLEVILKNRSAPQIRVLRNAMKELGNSVAFRLHGQKSNRDAVGAAITVEAGGHRQTKYLQGGSGFLSQHSKEIFFGIGTESGDVTASIRWPSGLLQKVEHLPVNNRIEIREGAKEYTAKAFGAAALAYEQANDTVRAEELPSSVETWLIEPVHAPDFSLLDLDGKTWSLASLQGEAVLLHFWMAASPESREQLRLLHGSEQKFTSAGLRIVGINVDDPAELPSIQAFIGEENLDFPIIVATQEVAGVYTLFFRYLFDRRRDLPIPVSLLVNNGMIVKVYQGPTNPDRILGDFKSIPASANERVKKALPFAGTLYSGEFQRNDFTYGVAFFQRGYFEQAAAAFKQVIATKPGEPEAYYNLGTLYLRSKNLEGARHYLENAVKLRANYPEAWNNLGMIAAQENKPDEAVRNFQQSLQQKADYTVALLNLGSLYRTRGVLDEAETFLSRALELEPDNPEANYAMGMLYAREEKLEPASQLLDRAISLRPDYPDALNNLGVLLVREQRYSDAEDRFKACIRVARNFDQAYLNLARLYVLLKEKDKAREVLQALLKEQPQHKLAQQALEMLN